MLIDLLDAVAVFFFFSMLLLAEQSCLLTLGLPSFGAALHIE